MSIVKIIKILLIIIIIIPVIAIFLFYTWFLYEASKLDKQRHIPLETYTTEQIIENINIATNTTENNNVNTPGISQEWWKEYDLAIDNLDTNYFVTNFETYKPNNKSKGLTNKQISEIAQKGFEESAKRIAGEGASNKDEISIKKYNRKNIKINNESILKNRVLENLGVFFMLFMTN